MTALKPKAVNRSDVEAAIRAREVAWGAICKGILSKVSRYEREALREHYVEADKHLSRVLDWREDFLRGGGE